MKTKKTNFNYIEKFKTEKESCTLEELKQIFNEKLFKLIIHIEKNNLRGCV